MKKPPDSVLLVTAGRTDHRALVAVARLLGLANVVQVVCGPWASIHELCGCAPKTIIVMPGVDLDRHVGGEGPLGRILRGRQASFRGDSTFLVLRGEEQ